MSETITLFSHKKDCCGCEACSNLCPSQAITMRPSDEGFLYPSIDPDRCSGCGLCLSLCPMKTKPPENKPSSPLTYAAFSPDWQQAASGGIFSALAKHILLSEGYVCGCEAIYTPMLSVSHTLIDHTDQLYRLQGSKYVQSRMGTIYHSIAELCQQGKTVLFCGTPCQVAGLRAFFQQQPPSNLYLIDLVCHGVPSEQMFSDYIHFLEKQLHGTIRDFRFRDKTNGWGLQAKLCYLDRKQRASSRIIASSASSYYSLFLDSEIYRDSCYSCPYAGGARPGDLSIGDFWGIEEEHPEYLAVNGGALSLEKGISCLMVNTEKGQELLSSHGQQLSLYSSSFEKASRHNRQLRQPSQHSPLRQQIFSAYTQQGYAAVERLFAHKLGIRYPVRKFKEWQRNHFSK